MVLDHTVVYFLYRFQDLITSKLQDLKTSNQIFANSITLSMAALRPSVFLPPAVA